MPLTTITQFARVEELAVALCVEQSGMSLTVKAGKFRAGGVAYTLLEDQTFTATKRSESAYVDARLVEHEGEVLVLVDEAVDEDGQCADLFDWGASPYKELWPIFWFKILPDTVSLDDVTITVIQVEAPPVPVEPEEEEEGE